MSRLAHFTKGLSASWMATLATVLYGFASVPIALRYLSVEEFGLFMLMLQIAGYFTLIELGMAGATARILVDYKDQPNDGSYGSTILTGSAVFAVQALIIAAVGLAAAPWIVALAGVPEKMSNLAIYLLRWLCTTFAFATAMKVFSSLLYANKRLDFMNAITAATVLIGLVLMAIILASGAGLRGLVVMFVAQVTLTVLFNYIACRRLKLLPRAGCWGKPSFRKFQELFSLAKDFFLVSAGSQVLEASQLIIVTRTMGLTSAAVWSASTKVFALLYQLLTKIQGTAVVFLSEMMVRGESERLKIRFRQTYQVTAGLAAVALAAGVGINNPFVSIWAKPELAWGISLSALMGALVFLNTVTRCHVDLIIHTKYIRALRYVYFLEAAAFVGLSLLSSPKIGFYGVLLSALSCLILARFWYVAHRIAVYFEVGMLTVCWSWLRRSLIAIMLMVPFVATAGVISSYAAGACLQLVAAIVWVSAPALVILNKCSLPGDVSRAIQTSCLNLLPFKSDRFRRRE